MGVWIEAERAEDIPRRHLPSVLVTTDPLGVVGVFEFQDPTYQLRCLVRLADKVVAVDRVVVWLIAVPILAEVLGALLPTGRVAAMHREKLIKSLGSVRITAKQVNQPLGVLHDMPEPLPGVALAIVVVALPVPSEWAESVHL